MRKVKCIFCGILLSISVISSFAQFYDVKQKKPIISVNTRRETVNIPINSNIEALAPESPALVPDTLTDLPLLCSPLDTLIITSNYGYRIDPFTNKRKFHHGTDFKTYSENVYAMMHGRVRKIGYNKILGNYIELDHGDFTVTYAHLHTVIGEKGDYVRAGQSVGISGSTGRSTGEHLHLSMRYKDKSIDPLPIVRYIHEWRKQFFATLPLTPSDTIMLSEVPH